MGRLLPVSLSRTKRMTCCTGLYRKGRVFADEDYADLIVARLLDFVHRRSPWQRRLWRTGLALELRELAEYSLVFAESAATGEEGLKYVFACLTGRMAQDPGLTDEDRDLLTQLLDLKGVKTAEGRARIEAFADRLSLTYIDAWRASAATSASHRPPIELAARSLAAHLLDLGFSSDHLHGWLTFHSRSEEEFTLADLADSAREMAARPEAEYSVLVPFDELPDEDVPETSRFDKLSGTETTARLQGLDTSGLRYTSSLLFRTRGRDPWAAVERAQNIVARLRARSLVGVVGAARVVPSGAAFIEGKNARYQLDEPRRQIEVGAISRQAALFDVAEYNISTALDDALELAATLESGAPGAAISGGWAAIEGLLSYADVRGDAHKAADRLAALVACSYPRAELTTLSYRHDGDGDLSQELEVAEDNQARCLLVEEWLKRGQPLSLSSSADRAAARRMKSLVDDPSVLIKVRDYVTQTLRRLFNQRNLVMHSGRFGHVALEATLRTAPPLVGAGLDRVVHASLESGGEVDARTLAARAENELNLLRGGGAERVSCLLDG